MERVTYIGFLSFLIFIVCILSACGRSAMSTEQSVPYAIDIRPLPAGSNLDTLLPSRVETFQREAFAPGMQVSSDNDVNSTYRSGDDTVVIGVSIVENATDAFDAINVTRDEAKASNVNLSDEQFSVGTDPSYFKTSTFIAWSRGTYFFYADASDREALDRFMQHFPY